MPGPYDIRLSGRRDFCVENRANEFWEEFLITSLRLELDGWNWYTGDGGRGDGISVEDS